jgi:hypothetical protein
MRLGDGLLERFAVRLIRTVEGGVSTRGAARRLGVGESMATP